MEYNYITVLKNWIYGYDRYTALYSKKNIPQSTFPNVFYLLKNDELDIGLKKAKSLSERKQSPIIRITTNIASSHVYKNTKNGLGWWIPQDYIKVSGVFILINNEWMPISIEDMTAMAFKNENHNMNWNRIKPRSLSYLPIAQACQAKCKFCFSDYSISFEKRLKNIDLINLEKWCLEAKQNSAERFVITGGGEPGLLKHDDLISILKVSSTFFHKNILITNGLFLKKNANAIVKNLKQNGLTTLSISAHHYDNEKNTNIMGIDTGFKNNIDNIEHKDMLRLICVLQKTGIHDHSSLKGYLDFAIENKIPQVTFKELYVSSILETKYADSKENKYSEINRVPLSVVLEFASDCMKVAELPWGSPVFEYNNQYGTVRFCAYTEPSVGWELYNRLARSWNLMSDGTCYASLEDINSKLEI